MLLSISLPSSSLLDVSTYKCPAQTLKQMCIPSSSGQSSFLILFLYSAMVWWTFNSSRHLFLLTWFNQWPSHVYSSLQWLWNWSLPFHSQIQALTTSPLKYCHRLLTSPPSFCLHLSLLQSTLCIWHFIFLKGTIAVPASYLENLSAFPQPSISSKII